MRGWFCWLLLGALGSMPALALGALVIDEQKRPVSDARACYMSADTESICVTTDSTGRFELPRSSLNLVRVVAPGFHPEERWITELDEPVILRESPALLVKLVDADSGAAIKSGEVFVAYSSGAQRGPFPANAAGVIIRRVLAAGPVMIRATVPGYKQTGPYQLTLTPGKQSEVRVELRRSGEDR